MAPMAALQPALWRGGAALAALSGGIIYESWPAQLWAQCKLISQYQLQAIS